ncbi:MAG: WYL domain-containing protein [Bacteroidia bacterium]|nr:WYL domain-containing protein [Bacteroidia bacterium]
MSKRGYISRYFLIIKKIKNTPNISYNELTAQLEKELQPYYEADQDLFVGFSQRTFQRDVKDIKNIFGVEIEYNRTSKGYYIADDESAAYNFERVLEAFDMFTIMNVTKSIAPYIHLEQRKALGTQHIAPCIKAIKNKTILHFSYANFWAESAPTKRTVEPYLLKEYKGRWYLMVIDTKDGNTKSFSLDRMTNVEGTSKKFKLDTSLNIAQNYAHCFGIVSPNAIAPSNVVLAFNAHQGNYIKTMPLHASQHILSDTPTELHIQLSLYITHDFVMELLSYGSNVKVLSPKTLATQLKKELKQALQQYN